MSQIVGAPILEYDGGDMQVVIRLLGPDGRLSIEIQKEADSEVIILSPDSTLNLAKQIYFLTGKKYEE